MIAALRRKLLQNMVHDRSESDNPSTIQSVSRRRSDRNYAKAAAYASDRDVLDIGPGFGIGYEHLLAAGPRSMTCMDYFDQAREHFTVQDERIRFELGDFLDNGFADHSFDTVLCIATIYYLPDTERLFSEIRRVLRPGGHLVINQFDRDLIRFFFGMELCDLDPRYGRLQSADELLRLVEARIGPVRESLVQSPFRFAPAWRRALAAPAFPLQLATGDAALIPCPPLHKGVYNYLVAQKPQTETPEEHP